MQITPRIRIPGDPRRLRTARGSERDGIAAGGTPANRRQGCWRSRMTDWLRLILMIFYAPLRGMREVRDRGSLAPMVLCAYLSQWIYVFATQWILGNRAFLAHPM